MIKSKRIKLLRFLGKNDILTSITFWFIVLLVFGIHIVLAITSSEINYIGSFGAVLTVFGLLASFTHSLYPSFTDDLKEPYQPYNDMYQLTYHANTSFAIDRSLTDYPIEEKEATKLNQEYNEIVINKYKSLINTYFVTIFGTLIWSYAGYFKFIFCACKL